MKEDEYWMKVSTDGALLKFDQTLCREHAKEYPKKEDQSVIFARMVVSLLDGLTDAVGRDQREYVTNFNVEEK